MNRVISYIASIIVVLLVIPVHEFAHAFVAVKAGDPTPKLNGRYTINPIKHFDLAGLLMLVVVHFGWAKPVPINPYNFRHLRKDYFWVSVAGIIANFCMAFIFSLFYSLFVTFGGLKYFNSSSIIISYLFLLIYYVLAYGVIININLMLFNLIPVFPLDGFRILDCILKRKGRVFEFLRTKGMYVLLGLLIWGFVCDMLKTNMPIMQYFDVFGITLGYISDKIMWLFTSFWGLFF